MPTQFQQEEAAGAKLDAALVADQAGRERLQRMWDRRCHAWRRAAVNCERATKRVFSLAAYMFFVGVGLTMLLRTTGLTTSLSVIVLRCVGWVTAIALAVTVLALLLDPVVVLLGRVAAVVVRMAARAGVEVSPGARVPGETLPD